MHTKHLTSRTLLLVGLLLALVSCTEALPPNTSTTPTVDSAHSTAFARFPTNTPLPPTPTPKVASAANLGPAPRDCPLGPPLPVQRISPTIVPLGGISPVWSTLDGSGSGEGGGLAGDTWSADGGWPIKIVWEVGPNYHHSVLLQAGNLRDGTLLKWHMSPDELLTTSPVLDPQHPGHAVSVIGLAWNEWGSEVLIPAAGCYYVEATWPEGHWRVTFAAGL